MARKTSNKNHPKPSQIKPPTPSEKQQTSITQFAQKQDNKKEGKGKESITSPAPTITDASDTNTSTETTARSTESEPTELAPDTVSPSTMEANQASPRRPPPTTPQNKRRQKENQPTDYAELQRGQLSPSERKIPAKDTGRVNSPPPRVRTTFLSTVQEEGTPTHSNQTRQVTFNSRRSVSTTLLRMDKPVNPVDLNRPVMNRPRRFANSSVPQPPGHAVRLTGSMRITPTMNEEMALAILAEEFFDCLFNADKTTKIWPWQPTGQTGPLSKDHLPPISYAFARKYIDRFYVRPRVEGSFQLWYGVYISLHSEQTISEFLHHESLQTFKRDHNGVMFVKEIQAATTKQIGWGLYSTPSTDGQRIQEFFQEKYNLTVACRWRPILYSEEKDGKSTVTVGDQESKVFALHFEVAQEDQHRARRILQPIYSVDSKEFPLRCHMRLVPHIFDCQTSRKKKGANFLRSRQRSFLSNLDTTRIHGVQNWDKRSPHLGDSHLLEIIQNLTNPKNASHQDPRSRSQLLFLGAKPSSIGTSQIDVHYFKQHEEVATEIAAELYAYLRSTMDIDPDDPHALNTLRALQTYFFPDIIQFSQEKIWDPNTLRIIGMEDLQINALVQGEGGFDEFLDDNPIPDDLKDNIMLENAPTLEQTHIERLLTRQDVDSVGTFRSTATRSHAGAVPVPTPVPTPVIQPFPSDLSLSTPTTSTASTTRSTFTDFMARYGIHAGDRTSMEELDTDELIHLREHGAYIPIEIRHRLPKMPTPAQSTTSPSMQTALNTTDMSHLPSDSEDEKDSDDDRLPVTHARTWHPTEPNKSKRKVPSADKPSNPPKTTPRTNHYQALRESMETSDEDSGSEEESPFKALDDIYGPGPGSKPPYESTIHSTTVSTFNTPPQALARPVNDKDLAAGSEGGQPP